MAQSRLQWRRDGSTSALIRWLWGLGLGTFIAAIGLIVFSRLFALSGVSADSPLTIVILGAILFASVLVLGIDRWTNHLEVTAPLEVIGGALIMGTVIVALARGIGGGVGHGLATLTIPLGFLAIGIASFLRSVGTLDLDEGVLYLHEPDTRIDLETIAAVSVTPIKESAIVRLSYRQPGGTYVPGPRRLVLPAAVAQELRAAQESGDSAPSSSRVS